MNEPIPVALAASNPVDRDEASRQALEKERELHEMKSRFITMASHEFRTPMSTILSAAGLIDRYQGATEAPQRARNVARIREAIADLTAILDDFLNICTLGAQQIHPLRAEVDLPAFMADVLADVQPALRPGQHIRYLPSGRPGPVWVDGHMLRHILVNLLTNASKYSYDNNEICVSTLVSEAGLRLVVQDFGIGVPEEDSAHLFNDFFRARNAMHVQGTGLGLYIVRRYVELLGGRISFVSELERGTTFTAQFPLPVASL